MVESDEISKKIKEEKEELKKLRKKKRKINQEINDLIAYQQALEDQDNVKKQRAKIVQGVKRAVKKSLKTKPDVESLLDRDVKMSESGLEEIEFEAEKIKKYADKLFRYAANKRNNADFKESDVVDI